MTGLVWLVYFYFGKAWLYLRTLADVRDVHTPRLNFMKTNELERIRLVLMLN